MRSSAALRAWAAGALGYWIGSAAAGLLLLGNPFDESGDPSTTAGVLQIASGVVFAGLAVTRHRVRLQSVDQGPRDVRRRSAFAAASLVLLAPSVGLMAVASIAGFNATRAPAILLLFFAPVFLLAIPLVGWLVWRSADPGAW